jgi:hypothetical protein
MLLDECASTVLKGCRSSFNRSLLLLVKPLLESPLDLPLDHLEITLETTDMNYRGGQFKS